eukprot:768320-Hanusia_phi.AAC.5
MWEVKRWREDGRGGACEGGEEREGRGSVAVVVIWRAHGGRGQLPVLCCWLGASSKMTKLLLFDC